MEYLAGALVTLFTMYFVSKQMRQTLSKVKPVKIDFTQSRQYELVKDFLPIHPRTLSASQSSKFQDSLYTRIFFLGDDAYWIEDGNVYMAEFNDGNIDYENKIKVDMMAMNKVELDKMIFVVERLTEGLTDDSGNSRN